MTKWKQARHQADIGAEAQSAQMKHCGVASNPKFNQKKLAEQERVSGALAKR